MHYQHITLANTPIIIRVSEQLKLYLCIFPSSYSLEMPNANTYIKLGAHFKRIRVGTLDKRLFTNAKATSMNPN